MLQILLLLVGILPAIWSIMKAAGPVVARLGTNLLKSSKFGAMLANKLSSSRIARALLAGGTVLGVGTAIVLSAKAAISQLEAQATRPDASVLETLVATTLNSTVSNVWAWICYGTHLDVAVNALWVAMGYLATVMIYNKLTKLIYRSIGLTQRGAMKSN